MKNYILLDKLTQTVKTKVIILKKIKIFFYTKIKVIIQIKILPNHKHSKIQNQSQFQIKFYKNFKFKNYNNNIFINNNNYNNNNNNKFNNNNNNNYKNNLLYIIKALSKGNIQDNTLPLNIFKVNLQLYYSKIIKDLQIKNLATILILYYHHLKLSKNIIMMFFLSGNFH